MDPMAGSYYIEYLTDKIEERALKYIEQIDKMGGAVAAIEKGFMQREITESSYRFQREIEAKKRVIVGINDYVSEEKVTIKTLKIDPQVEKTLTDQIRNVKSSRNQTKAKEAIDRLHDAAAKENENLMPFILQAVREYVTLGEVCDTLRTVFGEYKPLTLF
jgi:methylmalonyl-CoA mutase N-terminal domain/subunit